MEVELDYFFLPCLRVRVLVNFYFQDDVDMGMMPIDIEEFVDAFERGFNREATNADSLLVQSFEGRDALVVNVAAFQDTGITETEMNQHPGVISLEDPSDPTMRAVFLGIYESKYSGFCHGNLGADCRCSHTLHATIFCLFSLRFYYP